MQLHLMVVKQVFLTAKKNDGTKTSNIRGIPKLMDANPLQELLIVTSAIFYVREIQLKQGLYLD